MSIHGMQRATTFFSLFTFVLSRIHRSFDDFVRLFVDLSLALLLRVCVVSAFGGGLISCIALHCEAGCAHLYYRNVGCEVDTGWLERYVSRG